MIFIAEYDLFIELITAYAELDFACRLGLEAYIYPSVDTAFLSSAQFSSCSLFFYQNTIKLIIRPVIASLILEQLSMIFIGLNFH